MQVVNAHLQYLPAYTELYKTTKDPDVAARLYELMDIFATKLPAPGYVAQFYTLNWTALTNKTDNATIIPRVIVGICLPIESVPPSGPLPPTQCSSSSSPSGHWGVYSPAVTGKGGWVCSFL